MLLVWHQGPLLLTCLLESQHGQVIASIIHRSNNIWKIWQLNCDIYKYITYDCRPKVNALTPKLMKILISFKKKTCTDIKGKLEKLSKKYKNTWTKIYCVKLVGVGLASVVQASYIQACTRLPTWFTWYVLKHWGRDKMAAIFQTTFSNAFSWMKIC